MIGQRPAPECQRSVAAMVSSMKHEAFHDAGTCEFPEIGLYAGWVVHNNGSAAPRGALTRSNDVSILLSGECHVDTPASGVKALYQQLGAGFVARLNGVFSGLLIDERRKCAYLFNDRYGLERIYFHETKDALYFASEAKALLAVVPELRALDDVGVAQLFAFGCTHDWRTVFRGVGLLEGGSLWILDPRKTRKEKYFDPKSWEGQSALSAEEFDEQFNATFRRALPRYCGTGAGLGISLTGGLDTRLIMACLPALTHRPTTYTFSGQHERTLDERLAGRVAAACGLEHRVLRIGHSFLSDYGRYVDRTVYITDGTFGATGAHEIYLNAQARSLAPVRLTGNFGSEVLRGMSTFKPIRLAEGLFHRDIYPLIMECSTNRRRPDEHQVTFSAFEEIPWRLYGSLAAARSQITFRTPYVDNDLVALAFRAPAEARRSADALLGLVARNNPPLGNIPTDRGLVSGDRGLSRLMRRTFADLTFKLDYLDKEGLPHWLTPLQPAFAPLSRTGVLGLHKYLPFRRWFQQDLSAYITDVLTDARTSRLPYWNKAFLHTLANDHSRGRKNYIHEINAVLTLEAVDRLLIRGGARPEGCSLPQVATAANYHES